MTRAERRLHPARGAHRHRQLARAPTSSSRSTPTPAATRAARGIETYFLNFAKNPHAEAVAARENAISAATLKDLQGLVKAITLNSKIDESRDFAASVQEAMVENIREQHPACGPRRAHGALLRADRRQHAERAGGDRLREQPGGREAPARRPSTATSSRASLFAACAGYLEALNRTQMRQLTGSEAPVYSGRRRTARREPRRHAVTWIKVEKPIFDLVGVIVLLVRARPASCWWLAVVRGPPPRALPDPPPPPQRPPRHRRHQPEARTASPSVPGLPVSAYRSRRTRRHDRRRPVATPIAHGVPP